MAGSRKRDPFLANHLYVFCRSGDTLPLKELGNHIATIGLLDETPRFKPTLDSPEANDPNWTYVEVVHSPGKRPIQLHRVNGAEDMAPAISDALEALSENCEPKDHPDLDQRIRQCRQIFHFELGLQLPDDVWEALDATQSYIAKALDGIIYASNGFYDNDLEPICEWE